jgi:transposase
MARSQDPKEAALAAARSLNPHPEQVRDPEFLANDFFDPRDVAQVKYEMVRKVEIDGAAVTEAAAAFGFSRPVFYAAAKALATSGLAGLVPGRPGPRGASKLTDEICAWVDEQLAGDPRLRPGQLAGRIDERFGVRAHPRSIERALVRYRERTKSR